MMKAETTYYKFFFKVFILNSVRKILFVRKKSFEKHETKNTSLDGNNIFNIKFTIFTETFHHLSDRNFPCFSSLFHPLLVMDVNACLETGREK